jgi:hypothetical protein
VGKLSPKEDSDSWPTGFHFEVPCCWGSLLGSRVYGAQYRCDSGWGPGLHRFQGLRWQSSTGPNICNFGVEFGRFLRPVHFSSAKQRPASFPACTRQRARRRRCHAEFCRSSHPHCQLHALLKLPATTPSLERAGCTLVARVPDPGDDTQNTSSSGFRIYSSPCAAQATSVWASAAGRDLSLHSGGIRL